MDNFDLAAAIRQHREHKGASLEEMAGKLNMSRSAYYRLESDVVKPTYVKAQEIMKVLKVEEPEPVDAAPPASRKWYRSIKLRWLIPIVISFVFFGLISETVGFREGYGEEELKNNPPDKAMILIGAVFCAFYYYTTRQNGPLRSQGNNLGFRNSQQKNSDVNY